MNKYKVEKIRRIREYKMLFSILSDYHTRNLDYENDGRDGTLYFAIPKADSDEMSKRLKESGLVFKVLE